MLCFCRQKTAYEMRISDGSSVVCSSDLSEAIQSGLSRPGLLRRFAPRNDGFVSEARKESRDVLAEVADGVAALHQDQRRDAQRRNPASQHCIILALQREARDRVAAVRVRSEEHTSELQPLMRITYSVSCLQQ